MKTEVKYSSDLTNRQWQLIRQLLPRRPRLGRRPIDRRRIINAILYVVRTGCQWRMLPQRLSELEHGVRHLLALAK